MTDTELKTRIETLVSLTSTPITNWFAYALELSRLQAELDRRSQAHE